MTGAFLSEGCKSVAAGMNPMDLRRGINLAVEHVVDDLKRRAKMISTTAEIAQARLAPPPLHRCRRAFMLCLVCLCHLLHDMGLGKQTCDAPVQLCFWE